MSGNAPWALAGVAKVTPVVLVAQAPGCGLHDIFPHIYGAGPEHDHGSGICCQVPCLAHSTGSDERKLVLFPLSDQIQIAVSDIGSNGMPHFVHRNIIGRSGPAVFTINAQGSGIRISGQVVKDRPGGPGAGDLGIDRHTETPGHGHGLDHLGHCLLDGVFSLVRGGGGEINVHRDTADSGNKLQYLVGHQKAAVPRLCTLAVLDLDGTRILNHIRQGMDDLIPSEVAGCDLRYEILQEARAQEPGRHAAFPGAHNHRHPLHLIEIGDAHCQALPHGRGNGAYGHAPDTDGEYLPHRRDEGIVSYCQ